MSDTEWITVPTKKPNSILSKLNYDLGRQVFIEKKTDIMNAKLLAYPEFQDEHFERFKAYCALWNSSNESTRKTIANHHFGFPI